MATPTPPFVTEQLVRRIDRAANRFTLAWLEGIERLPGNPRGMRLERFGSAIAPAAEKDREVDFMNRVVGLYPEDADRVDDILAFYRGLGIRPWFELIPAEGFERLAERLATGEAAQIGFHGMLYGLPRAPDRNNVPHTVKVTPVSRQSGNFGVFAETLLRGHELPEHVLPDAREDIAHWPEVEGWHLYLATVDGDPAAAAALTMTDGVGYLASASTLPSMRGRGCQAALIRRRIEDAATAGCDLIGSLASVGSASYRNLQRAGMRVACSKAVWRARGE